MDIEIRHAEPGDYEAVHRIYTQPRVVADTLQLPFVSTEKRRRELAEPQPGYYPLVALVNGEVVGHLGLRTFPNSPRRKHVASFGMGVHDAWQRKGIGSALVTAAIDYARRWLNVTRMELSVFVDNEPAVRLYKKFGYEIEGRQRDYAFRDGAYADVYNMAKLLEPSADTDPRQ
jgi:putative acetyltransferase